MVYINWSDIALFQRLEGWENVRVTGETTPLRVVIVRDHVCVCVWGGGGGECKQLDPSRRYRGATLKGGRAD